MAEEYQRQPYDSALKSLMEDHAAEMLPEILPESRLISEQNAEIARTNLRPDIDGAREADCGGSTAYV